MSLTLYNDKPFNYMCLFFFLIGDGRMESPGHSAQYCTYTFMEIETHKILCQVTMDKRMTGRNSAILDINQLSYVNFIPTPEENIQFKNYLKVLLGRKIVDHMPEFKWMDKVLPDHIPHDLQQEMSTASKIFMLPVLLKNEACYSDCLHILDNYVEDINRIYAKAGRGNFFNV